MSASLGASAAAAISVIAGSASSVLSSARANVNTGGTVNALPNVSTTTALFREIHKNTWLKRLTADGKKITVGPKKSERSWVVFCVHDDCEALLEGYAEPRQAASHSPEWIVSLQETQHISHALIPNSHEFEFVVTLQNEVVRFHAMSWEVMQEWVETMRSKLREMKILSPRENLYTKLPEIRAPLLPTRDPTSPLPATPPVPAAIVPGVERVVPQSVLQPVDVVTSATNAPLNCSSVPSTATNTTSSTSSASSTTSSVLNVAATVSSHAHSHNSQTPALTSMSNTLTQNLINMLSNPITAYSEQLQEANGLLASNSSDTESLSERGMFGEYDCDLVQSGLSSKPNHLPNESGIALENSVRLDVGNFDSLSLDSNGTSDDLIHCERIIPRPQTSRSHSAGAADSERKPLIYKPMESAAIKKCIKKSPSNSNNNITELEIKSLPYTQLAPTTITTSSLTSVNTSEETSTPAKDSSTNITIIQVSNSLDQNKYNSAEINHSSLSTTPDNIFKFPQNTESLSITTTKQDDTYKSNVQINPSSLNNSTIHVGESVSTVNSVTAVANQYSTPVKGLLPQKKQTNKFDCAGVSSIVTNTSTGISSPRSHLENHKITTVLVGNPTTSSIYGTCYNSSEVPSPAKAVATASPVLKKKIILSANSSGITNISVNNAESENCDERVTIKSDVPDDSVKCNVGNVRYEKVFLSSSTPIALKQDKINESLTTSSNASQAQSSSSLSMLNKFVSSQLQTEPALQTEVPALNASSLPSSPRAMASMLPSTSKKPMSIMQHNPNLNRHNLKYSQSEPLKQEEVTTTTNPSSTRSPAMQRKRIPLSAVTTNSSVILPKTPPVPVRSRFLTRGLTEAVITARPSRRDLCSATPRPKAASSTKSDNRNTTAASINNNEEVTKSVGATTSASHTHVHENCMVNRRRSESLEQRRRSSSSSEAHTQKTRITTNNNELLGSRVGGPSAMRMQQPPHPVCLQSSVPIAGPSASKRMTLREQQVMQLRREIMHPGGVRLQLRRKDCIGSIAWVDAFGGVWVAGWKQKDHPVLYNALHIGDQLISIAGVTIGVAADANKVIRNTNTLFVEVLIRRIPLGRGYAIRREREGQCLGLIRDGNTSTIVDVVPNSLAAKHGLPPKAQSCDGSTLTFWVLTEINGRPLNLFFKENEIRDRLNSVGRDISILVQPSDLIAKLKKQLKSMRGYKDYLVQ